MGKLINRLIMGSEKSEDFARSTLPSNRWELFWDIVKGSFGKLVLANLLILLFFIPLLLIFYFRYQLNASYATLYPYAQGFGVGYQAPISMQGFSESINLSANIVGYIFMPIAMFFAALGVSGGAYLMRNMVWSEGVFVANDFWKGIKQNYKQIVIICLIYSLVFYITTVSASFAASMSVEGGTLSWLYVVGEVLSYIILGYFSVMTLFMITTTVTYDMPLKNIIKNSFFFTLLFFPHCIVMVPLAALPFILLALGTSSTILLVIVIVLLAVFGFSYTFLVWTNFSQWTFDNFINDKVPGAKKNRGMYQKIAKESDGKAKLQHKAQYAVRTSLNSRPIKPITDEEIQIAELPESFSREDLLKLRESKQNMIEDHKRYVEEHINDEQYQKTPEELENEAKEKARLKKIEQAKKALRKYDNNK